MHLPTGEANVNHMLLACDTDLVFSIWQGERAYERCYCLVLQTARVTDSPVPYKPNTEALSLSLYVAPNASKKGRVMHRLHCFPSPSHVDSPSLTSFGQGNRYLNEDNLQNVVSEILIDILLKLLIQKGLQHFLFINLYKLVHDMSGKNESTKDPLCPDPALTGKASSKLAPAI